MKPFSFLVGLLTLLPLSHAMAQSNFQPGYVVTAAGDTLEGYIDVSRLEYTVKAVLFKAAPAAEPVRYTPLQVTAFRAAAASAAFVGQVLSLDQSPVRTDQLLQAESHMEFLRLNRPVADTVFLEVLTGGKVSLYRYNDEKAHYFARKTGGDWQELPLYKYILKRNGTRSLVQMEAYKDQLALLLADCPQVAELARNTAYTEAALVKIVRAYNACMGERAAPVATSATSRAHFGITAGVSGTSLHVRQETGATEFSRSWMPAGGMYLELPLQRKLEHWTYYGEAAYKGYRPANSRVTMDLKYVRMNHLLRYRYLKWSVRPFVQAGFSVGYAFGRSQQFHNAAPYLPKPQPMEYGLIGGAGIQAGRISLEGRYEAAKGVMANYFNTNGVSRSVSLLLGYQFR
jgi:hypothetical protein